MRWWSQLNWKVKERQHHKSGHRHHLYTPYLQYIFRALENGLFRSHNNKLSQYTNKRILMMMVYKLVKVLYQLCIGRERCGGGDQWPTLFIPIDEYLSLTGCHSCWVMQRPTACYLLPNWLHILSKNPESRANGNLPFLLLRGGGYRLTMLHPQTTQFGILMKPAGLFKYYYQPVLGYHYDTLRRLEIA